MGFTTDKTNGQMENLIIGKQKISHSANSRPMSVGEHHPAFKRFNSQMRSSLLPGAFASAPAFAGRYRASSWEKTWRCVPMRPWRFKIRLSPSVSGHSAVCLLSCATKICRAETNIKKSRDIPPNSQKLLLLLPVSIYLRKKT